jgi:hypothetical protein
MTSLLGVLCRPARIPREGSVAIPRIEHGRAHQPEDSLGTRADAHFQLRKFTLMRIVHALT